jgi:hypothetical protein
MGNNKALLICLLLIPSLALAHGGRTNSAGCHNDTKNGGYHCHGGGVPSPSTYSSQPQSLATQSANLQTRDKNIAADKDLILKIQTALTQLGYSAGTPDGVLREQTVKAIKHFQVDSDLPVDGKPTYLLLKLLSK